MGLKCSCCGAEIEGFPRGFSMDAPWWLTGVPEAERERRVKSTSDTCVIDDKVYLVRGNLSISINEADEEFSWGVWCSLSRDSYAEMMSRVDLAERPGRKSWFGWLYSQLPGYDQPTWQLKTMVREMAPGERPWVEVEPGSHLIADEQAKRISVARWHALVKAAMAQVS